MARSAKTIHINRNDRAIFLGATGTGKTTLAKALMYNLPNVAVLDPKRTFTMPDSWEATITSEQSEVLSWNSPKPLIFRPGVEALGDADGLDWWFQWVFERGNTLAYIDEAMLATNGTTPPRWYAACIQLGRERGVGTWHATQRPARVPIVLLSESEHMFIFRLRHPEDMQRVAAFSDPAILERRATGHAFWYWNDRTQQLQYFAKADVGAALEGDKK